MRGEGRGENFLITNLPQLPSPCWCGGRGLVRALPGLSTIPANKTDTPDNTELQTATFSNLRRSAGLVPQYLLSGLTDIESSLGWSWYDLFKDITDIKHWLKCPATPRHNINFYILGNCWQDCGQLLALEPSLYHPNINVVTTHNIECELSTSASHLRFFTFKS